VKHSPQAEFTIRSSCIACGGARLTELSRGLYTDQPLAGFLNADPWGENPMPFLQTATWELVKCDHCSQVFHRRILDEKWNERRFSQWMSGEAIKEFESGLGPKFPREFGAAQQHVEHILRIEKLTRENGKSNEPVRLLDFGCGFGHFLEACKHFGFDVAGVDRSVGRRSEASLKIIPSLDELKGAKFHAITLFEVLEHLDHPAQMIAELSRYLIPGGVLVLETPDCTGVTDIRSRLHYQLIHPLEHINAFTHGTLKSIAERQGFKEIARPPAVVTAEPKRAIKRLAKHALGKDGKSTRIYFRKATRPS
jgi:SAM-dependent methyltransferase